MEKFLSIKLSEEQKERLPLSLKIKIFLVQNGYKNIKKNLHLEPST